MVRRPSDHVLLAALAPLVFMSGCAVIQSPAPALIRRNPEETPQETVTAVETLVEGISGEEVNEEDLRALVKDLRSDEEARTAVQAIAEGMTPQKIVIKFCPICGKKYSPHLLTCPEHAVELQSVEE